MNFQSEIDWNGITLEIEAQVNAIPMSGPDANNLRDPADYSIDDAIIFSANGHDLTIEQSNFLFKISDGEIDDLIMETYQNEH